MVHPKRSRMMSRTLVRFAQNLPARPFKERNKLWRAGQAWLLAQKMGEAVDLMARIKAALDPQNILNPGKLFG
jgi:hypothetical protein